MWLFLALVALPLIEIALFVQIGGMIGLWPTLAIVLLSAMLGVFVLRAQQWQAPNELRAALERSRDPAAPIAHSALRMVGAMLLVAPGFFTDTLGLALQVPALRHVLLRWLLRHVQVVQPRRGPHRGGPAPGDVIEGDYEVTDGDPPQHSRPTHHIDNDTRH